MPESEETRPTDAEVAKVGQAALHAWLEHGIEDDAWTHVGRAALEAAAALREETRVTDAEVANDDAGPFSIGQDAVWPGLAKLAEECGEVLQVIGKLIATGGRTNHWSGRDLLRDLEDELADVQAAAAFVIAENALLDQDRIHSRAGSKVGLFSEWHGDDSDYHKRLWNAYLYGRRNDGLPRY